MRGYFWPDRGETPASINRQRDLAAAMMARNGAPRDVGEGLSALGDAIVARVLMDRAAKAEAEGRAGWESEFKSAFPIFPAAPAAPSDNPSDVATQRVAQAFGDAPSRSVTTAPTNSDWLAYANQGATRNQPLNDRLTNALGFLPDMGVTMKVFSGGQDAEGPHRTGSHRHDHGGAGDVFFYKDGRQLDWANKDDLPIFQDIVRRARANGVTGFGAGDGYMQPGSMHIGFGAPAVWGAGGRGANAPSWLTEAFNSPSRSAPPAVNAINAFAAGKPTQVASLDPSIGSGPPQPSMGGLTPANVADYAGRLAANLPARDEQTVPTPSPLPVGTPMATTEKGARVVRTLMDPQPMGGAPAPMTPPAQPQQVAQAQPDLSKVSPMAGGSAGAYQGPSFQQLMRLGANPWMPQSASPIIKTMMEQQLRAQDPAYQLDLDYKKAQLDALRRRGGSLINAGDGNIYDPQNDRWITAPNAGHGFRMATPEEAASYGSTAGQFGPDGRFYPVNPPSGMSVESDGQGGVRIVQGPGAGGKSFTEGQTKDNVYSTRARGALPTLNEYEDSLSAYGDRLLDNDPTGMVRGRWQSEDYQVAKAAGDEFLQAILRKDSGAAITSQEQELYGKTYLPQPGDKPSAVKYKRAARERAIAAIEAGMSPAQIIAQERALTRSQQAENIPPAAADMLRKDPSLASQFDEKYGSGAAARILGGQ